jgi:hypothetical protein
MNRRSRQRTYYCNDDETEHCLDTALVLVSMYYEDFSPLEYSTMEKYAVRALLDCVEMTTTSRHSKVRLPDENTLNTLGNVMRLLKRKSCHFTWYSSITTYRIAQFYSWQ